MEDYLGCQNSYASRRINKLHPLSEVPKDMFYAPGSYPDINQFPKLAFSTLLYSGNFIKICNRITFLTRHKPMLLVRPGVSAG